MGMIICPKCGKKIPDTSRKCSGCGFDGIASYLLNAPREIDNEKRRQEMEEGIRRDEERNARIEARQKSTPQITCPYCHSTRTKKITQLSRMASIGFWGVFSKKIGKQWHCEDCGSDF